ncbi:MAG: hypothetical protein AB1941_14520 [Gemmatimonadota bacterium]
MIRHIARTAFALVLLAGSAVALDAQGLAPPPSTEQCQTWTQDLSAGGARALDALTYGWIGGCPTLAAPALAGAIRNARTAQDTMYLGRLAGQAANVRDPQVLDAALALAGDRTASDRARVMAVLVLLGQRGSGLTVGDMPLPALFTERLPATGICGFHVATGGAEIVNPLPDDHVRRIAQVLDGIRYQNGESALLRNLARCARTGTLTEVPLQVDVSKIRLDYVCGNTFRIQNHTPEFLILSYTVAGTGEAEDVTARSGGGWTHFNTDTAGTVQLIYDGQVVTTAANTGKSCGGKGN